MDWGWVTEESPRDHSKGSVLIPCCLAWDTWLRGAVGEDSEKVPELGCRGVGGKTLRKCQNLGFPLGGRCARGKWGLEVWRISEPLLRRHAAGEAEEAGR